MSWTEWSAEPVTPWPSPRSVNCSRCFDIQPAIAGQVKTADLLPNPSEKGDAEGDHCGFKGALGCKVLFPGHPRKPVYPLLLP